MAINEEEKNDEENLIKIDNNNLDNNNFSRPSFFSQLGSHIKKGYFSLWRNKGFAILELLMGLFILYVYIIVYYNLLGQQSEKNLSLTKLLEYNTIYICQDNKEFFEKSYVYDKLCSVNIKGIDGDNNYDKEEFIENIYQNSLGHIGKGGICIKNLNSQNENYEVINSEIPLSIPSYIVANSMLTVSSYLKKEYDINAAIFDKIINKKMSI